MSESSHSEGDQTRRALTAEERAVLNRAEELGYFEIPRKVSLVALAEDLDRSDLEVSHQLRRGTGTVLRETDLSERG